MTRSQQPLITRKMLTYYFKKLGISKNQTVMLHISVKSIGWIEIGPEVVIQSLLDVLSPKGTLMMYVGWNEAPDEKWSEAIYNKYLENNPPFDPLISKANPNYSILAECLRNWSGAFRSNHPEASIAAVGAKAEWITKNHPINYPYGYGSPLEKLCNLNGKILLVGAPLNTITLLHYAENLAKIPNKRIIHYKVPIKRNNRKVIIEIEDFDSTKGIVANAEEYFKKIISEYLESGKGQRGIVGAANSYLFEADDLKNYAIEWLERIFG
jgi:aminoglycoside 3-N-acetyltransferase